MNAQEAAYMLGLNRRHHGDLREMLRALTLYPWLNSAEDEKRRVAVQWALLHWQSTRTNALGVMIRRPLAPGRRVFDADRGKGNATAIAATSAGRLPFRAARFPSAIAAAECGSPLTPRRLSRVAALSGPSTF